jgi:hydroxymethylpyrimidine kinase/phosphomethylpyrimidine kinase
MALRALTVAGSDSGGGAGIQADLKTFSAFGIYGLSAVTAVTAQNTETVAGVHALPADFVRLQIKTVLSDIGADGVKTGMLYDAAIIRAVAEELNRHSMTLVVVDPVAAAKDNSPLLKEKAVEALINDLLPFCALVTPNLPEAELLTAMTVRSIGEMEAAAERIYKLGSSAVLVKGGHLEGDPVDVLFDGGRMIRFPGNRIGSRPAHGTGCTLSSAILSNLLLGLPLEESVRVSKAYVESAIRNGYSFGKGALVLNHGVAVPVIPS